ncbi:MAG TPA: glucose-6-phosphate isomerase, partial [Epsilonproteobacteria bacterium]|nr:glucose-6-phosphate isomerase [Campylobacterota bacterium]
MTNKLYFQCPLNKDKDAAFSAIVKESKQVGYYALPEQDISSLLTYEKSIDDSVEAIAVIGIGGSSLGAKAIYEFLKPVTKMKRKLYFFESTDPININALLQKLTLQKTHFLVISKSGTTVETFSIYKYIYSLQSDPLAYTFITDPNSPLEEYAQTIQAKVLHLPDNVGGRFSVLSVVGLTPLLLASVDIQALLDGALSIKKSFFEAGYMQETLLKKAAYYAKNHAQYPINCLFAYCESL